MYLLGSMYAMYVWYTCVHVHILCTCTCVCVCTTCTYGWVGECNIHSCMFNIVTVCMILSLCSAHVRVMQYELCICMYTCMYLHVYICNILQIVSHMTFMYLRYYVCTLEEINKCIQHTIILCILLMSYA